MSRWSKAYFADIDELEKVRLARCVASWQQQALIRSASLFPGGRSASKDARD